VHAAVAHVHAIDDGISKRSAALDDPATHGADVVILSARASADQTEPRKLSVSGICEIPGEVLAREILVRMFG